MSGGQYVKRACVDLLQPRVVQAKKLKRHVDRKGAGERFAIARKQAGLTQVALAKRAGLAQPSVSRFENGERGIETDDLSRLLDAASKAGINLDFVFSNVGAPLKRPQVMLDLTDEEAEELLRRRRLEKERK